MWVTADHVAHTVALPHPAELFAVPALARLARLLADLGPNAVDEIIEAAEAKIFDLVLDTDVDPQTEARFVAAPAPVDIFSAHVDSREQLVAAIEDIDQRWRLDVLMALQDLADGDI